MTWLSHLNRSVILWTRLTPPSGAQKKPAFLDYCVSKDQKFKKCESRGTAVTDAAVDFTAKVRLESYHRRPRQHHDTALSCHIKGVCCQHPDTAMS